MHAGEGGELAVETELGGERRWGDLEFRHGVSASQTGVGYGGVWVERMRFAYIARATDI